MICFCKFSINIFLHVYSICQIQHIAIRPNFTFILFSHLYSYAFCIVHQWKRTSVLNYLVYKNLFSYTFIVDYNLISLPHLMPLALNFCLILIFIIHAFFVLGVFITLFLILSVLNSSLYKQYLVVFLDNWHT